MTHSRKPDTGALLMSLDTAAARYEISRKTIEKHIRMGLIEKVKIGGATRLRIAEADAYYAPPSSAESGLGVGPPHG